MIAIPNERLRERAREKVMGLELAVTQTAFADSRAELEEELELARIALESLEAEAVAYIFKHPAGRLFWSLTDESNRGQSDVMPVYTAPPAPVSVPAAMEMDDDFDSAFEHGKAVGWNAYRAAMLQSFGNSEQLEPVTTTYKLSDAVEALRNSGIAIDAEKIQEERDALNSPAIPDGWVTVPEEPTHEMLEAGDEQFGTYDVYRRMIAAAPQQEVRP